MEELLIQRLHAYIVAHNPDLLVSLQSERKVTDYMRDKVASIADEMEAMLKEEGNSPLFVGECCMDLLTADLRPSKYNLISTLLSQEFEKEYTLMREAGTLTYEIINILSVCAVVFEETPLTEHNEDDRMLHYALLGCIQDYLWNTSE